MDFKSFALGYNAGASQKGGSVSQAELEAAIKKVVPEWALEETPPKDAVTSVNGKVGAVNLPIPSEAADVKADPVGTAETKTAALRDEVNGKLEDYEKSTAVNKKIGDHNVSTTSHEDLRLELKRLADRLNAALNSDDTSLDDLKEIVAYIKANKTLIDGVTASKVNVTDIVNNLTTNTANVPLSAAQGVALKLLIDSLEEIVEGKTTPEQVSAKIKTALTAYTPKEDADTLYADKQTTETALTEHREKIAELEEALENATVEFAPSIDWLNENGDTSKKYYLPDNYEYTYRKKLVTIKHEANTKNKDGLNKIASGNTMTPNPYNGIYTIDAVEVDKSWDSCKVTISGLEQLVCVYYDALWIYFFDESGTKLADVSSYSLGNVPAESPIVLPYEVDLARIEGGWANPVPFKASKYVMMSMGIKAGGIGISDIENLSVNFAPLDRTENVWGWFSTGVQHSNDQATQKNSEDIAALNERTTALEEEVEDLQKTIENGGMTYEPTREVLYAIGDSITYGTGVGGNINAWPTRLMDIMGYDTENSRNLGISGIGFCTPVLERTVRDVVDERDFSVADVVTVAAGVNDWKNGSAKVADFFTELEYCLGKIRSDNPYCKIFYILPFNFLPKDSVFETFWALGYKLPGTTEDYCFGNTLQEFVNLIKEKFEEEPLKSLDVHVFDMTKSPITRYNIETALIGGDDGIHPTAQTHKVLAREIARRISNA